jgi:hypothetical protein
MALFFFKRNDDFLLTPYCKHNYNSKQYNSHSFGLTNFGCNTCEGRGHHILRREEGRLEVGEIASVTLILTDQVLPPLLPVESGSDYLKNFRMWGISRCELDTASLGAARGLIFGSRFAFGGGTKKVNAVQVAVTINCYGVGTWAIGDIMLINFGSTKESDGSPSASSLEAGLTLSPPQASASPSATDSYNIFMPADFKNSSMVVYVMIHVPSWRPNETATVETTSATKAADPAGRRWQIQTFCNQNCKSQFLAI